MSFTYMILWKSQIKIQDRFFSRPWISRKEKKIDRVFVRNDA